MASSSSSTDDDKAASASYLQDDADADDPGKLSSSSLLSPREIGSPINVEVDPEELDMSDGETGVVVLDYNDTEEPLEVHQEGPYEGNELSPSDCHNESGDEGLGDEVNVHHVEVQISSDSSNVRLIHHEQLGVMQMIHSGDSSSIQFIQVPISALTSSHSDADISDLEEIDGEDNQQPFSSAESHHINVNVNYGDDSAVAADSDKLSHSPHSERCESPQFHEQESKGYDNSHIDVSTESQLLQDENVTKEETEEDLERKSFPENKCANCLSEFDETESKIGRISYPSDAKQEDNLYSAMLDISVVEALFLIFQIGKESLTGRESWFLCESCANILKVLYTFYQEFSKLTKTEAYILRKLREISSLNDSVLKEKRSKQKKQSDTAGVNDKEGSNCVGTKEVEWEEDEEDDGEVDVSDDDDFQASPSELAAAGLESSSTTSDDEVYVQVKKKKLQRSYKKVRRISDDDFWNESYKNVPSPKEDNTENDNKRGRKESRNRKVSLKGLTYDCNLCNDSFLKPRELKSHLQESHKRVMYDVLQEKQQEGEGEEGGQLINTEDEKETVKVEDSVVVCRICEKELSNTIVLKEHFTEVHEGELPFKCLKCDRCFSELSQYRRHEISHINPYKCRICLCGFRRADQLRSHWANEHASQEGGVSEEPSKKKRMKSEKIFRQAKEKVQKVFLQCEVCNKVFKREDHLKMHRRIHTGEKPFNCNICDKAFSDPRGLAYHVVTHSNERPYCCSSCGMTFKRLHHLNDHEKNHKDDIARPFSCEVCGKCFKYRKHLNSHRVIHGNAKDHQCSICAKGFNRKDNLRQHVKKVHGREPGPSTMSVVVASDAKTTTTSGSTTAPPIIAQTLTIDSSSLDQIVYMHL